MEEEDYAKCLTHELVPFVKMVKEVKTTDSMFLHIYCIIVFSIGGSQGDGGEKLVL